MPGAVSDDGLKLEDVLRKLRQFVNEVFHRMYTQVHRRPSRDTLPELWPPLDRLIEPVDSVNRDIRDNGERRLPSFSNQLMLEQAYRNWLKVSDLKNSPVMKGLLTEDEAADFERQTAAMRESYRVVQARLIWAMEVESEDRKVTFRTIRQHGDDVSSSKYVTVTGTLQTEVCNELDYDSADEVASVTGSTIIEIPFIWETRYSVGGIAEPSSRRIIDSEITECTAEEAAAGISSSIPPYEAVNLGKDVLERLRSAWTLPEVNASVLSQSEAGALVLPRAF
jgi:hypothetical protein